MRIKVFLLWVCLLALRFGSARAADPDPVWDRAVATVALAGRSVASRIETHTEVYNGSGKQMETHDKIQTLAGWNGQEPVWKVEETRDVVQKSGLTVSLDLGARDNPFFASAEGRASHERAGEDTLDGHHCIIFRFEETPPHTAPAQGAVSSQEAVSSQRIAPSQEAVPLEGAVPPTGERRDEIGPLVGVAWLDRETGTPLKMVYHPKEMPKHVSVYDLTVVFTVLPDGATVPRELDMRMKAGFLWYKRVVRLHKSFSGWTMPPDAVVKDPSPGREPADAW